MRVLIPLALFIIIVIFLGIGLFRDPKLVPSPLIGKPLPAFSLPTLHNPKKFLSNEHLSDPNFIGSAYLLNVWASWCAPCLQEHPFLMQLAQQGVPIYGLNYKDSRENALKLINRYGNPFMTTLHDEEGRVSIDLGVYGAPETFIVSPGGYIEYKHIGILNDEIWAEKLVPIIEKINAAHEANSQ